MKEKILFFLLALLTFIGISTKANATVYEVSTADEFIEHWTANDTIKLVADIDLSKAGSSYRVEKYTAELSGIKDTVDYVYTGDETDEEMDEHMTYYVIKGATKMFADELDGAYIHDIMFQDCQPAWETSGTFSGTAMLAQKANNCRFRNVFIHNIKMNGTAFWGSNDVSCFVSQDTGSTFVNVNAYACIAYATKSYAGIFAGEATNSTFMKCSAGYGCAVYSDGTADNSYVGGLVGLATNVKFLSCKNHGYVAAGKDCGGGIAGKSNDTHFTQCDNYGSVANADYATYDAFTATNDAINVSAPDGLSSDELDKICAKVGMEKHTQWALLSAAHGLAYSSLSAAKVIGMHNKLRIGRSLIEDSEFEFTTVDGIPYTNAPKVTDLSASYSTQAYIGAACAIVLAAIQIGQMIYEAQDDDDVGGIVGLMNGGSANYCTNYGLVFSTDAYGGGIVGDAVSDSPVINGCLNYGLVKGYEQTGGIVGRIETGTVHNCLNIGNVSSGNSDNKTFGRIYGQKDDEATSKDNYYASNTLGAESDDCRAVTMQMLASGEVAQLLNAKADSAMWRQTIGIDYYPTLIYGSDAVTADKIQKGIDPTVRTSNASTFVRALASQYSDIVLTGDIDLNTTMFNFSSRYMPFHGSIDGQNHRIKNVYVVTPSYVSALGANDNSNTNIGLLSYARNATFKDLELSDFVVQGSSTAIDTLGLFVANSADCTYTNVRLTGVSQILHSEDVTSAATWRSGGLVGYSKKDKFTDCWTGPLCYLRVSRGNAFYDYVEAGGIAGTSEDTDFLRCYNQAKVEADDDMAGGIVGNMTRGSLVSCLNMGAITGTEYVGGVAGHVVDANVTYCANTGTVKGNNETITESEIGGIVGVYEQDNTTDKMLSECANWGPVKYSDGDDFSNTFVKYIDAYVNNGNDGSIVGIVSGDATLGQNYFDCNTNGYSVFNTSVAWEPSSSEAGLWAYSFNSNHGGTYYYQDVDNNTFPTHMPVPIPAAGEVKTNYHCDGTFYHSNRYHSTIVHDANPNKFGICTICGTRINAIADANITISNVDDMQDFRYAVNKSVNFCNSTLTLDSDIDFKDVSFAPIGTEARPLLMGDFKGNFHRIKNLYLETYDGYTGLFGNISGESININDLIIDSTCVVRSSGYGVAGIIGVVSSVAGSTCNVSLSHCGNEAFVSGTGNIAGLVGSVTTNDNAKIYFENCYNTGTIKGDKESAALCGYARKNVEVQRSWNSGKVTGNDEGYPFIRYNTTDGALTAGCSYDVVGQGDNIPQFTSEELTSGRLTYLLNNSKDGTNSSEYNSWFQKIGTDAHPVHVYTSDNKVYHHDYYYCYAQDDILTLYDNEDSTMVCPIHLYDDDGICEAVEGEMHVQQPRLTDNAWQIKKLGNLYWVAQDVNAGNTQYDCQLLSDLKDNESVIVDGALNADYSTFRTWTPMGTTDHPFTKSFYGNGHVISGLYCDNGSNDIPTGLLGEIHDNAAITNLGVTNSYFHAYTKVGLIAGYSKQSTRLTSPSYTNLYASGISKGTQYIGGLFGSIDDNYLSTSSISNCYSIVKISREKDSSSSYDYVNSGALVGSIKIPSSVSFSNELTNCYYLNTVIGIGFSRDNEYGVKKTENDFRYGLVCQLLDDGQGVWAQALEASHYPTFGTTGVSYSRNVKANTWATLIVPFPVATSDDVQYYVYNSVEDCCLKVDKADAVEANIPCLFKAAADGIITIRPAESASLACCVSPEQAQVTNGNMIGTYEDLAVSPGSGTVDYYLAQNKLWRGDEAFSVPAFRSYLHMSTASGSKGSYLEVVANEGGTDGITTVEPNANASANCYNLAGQRVNANAKGIIIKNGKAYLVK